MQGKQLISRAAFILCLAWIGIFGTDSVSAQAIDRQDTRPLRSLPKDFAAPTPDGFGLPDPKPGPAQKFTQRDEAGFVLNGATFEGATVFSEAQLTQSIQEFIGRPTSIEDLEIMRQILTRLYIDAGYVNSGAVIPPQQIANGLVVFNIIEGRLTAVRPGGDKIGDDFGYDGQLAPNYVTDRLGLTPDKPLNVEQLRQSFGLLLEDPMIDRLRGQLKPGAAPGEAVLDLDVEIREPLSAWVSVNNYNSVSNGSVGASGGVAMFNLTGQGDISELQGTFTEGRREVSGRVAMPVLAGELTPFVEARYSTSEVVEAPFDALDISNEYFRIAAGVEWSLFKDSQDQIGLVFSIDRTTSETRLLGAPFPPAGIRSNVVKAYALRFSQEWVRRGLDEVLALRSTFSLGLDLLDATKGDPTSGDGEYFGWLGQAQYIRRINDRLRLLGRVQAQVTSDPLPSFEQIGLGGVNTVRGYRTNAISRDKGLTLSFEAPIYLMDIPIPGLSTPGEPSPLELTPFADYGAGWNHGEGFGSRTDLLGVGVGLSWRPTTTMAVDLAYGRPLITDNSIASGSDLTDEAIYFNVSLFTN